MIDLEFFSFNYMITSYLPLFDVVLYVSIGTWGFYPQTVRGYAGRDNYLRVKSCPY